MKNLYQYIAVAILIGISSCTGTQYIQGDDYSQDYSSQQDVTYQQFYNDLSPYGSWVNYQGYGYAWVPQVPGFRPYYTNGNWVYTNYGWTWASNYNWGWAPFHYGRWINDRSYGWVWIPGNEWAPAWVSWRSGGNYYGWAPLGPGMYGNTGSMSYNDWTFVPNQYINSPRINNYYINQSQNVTIINNTTIINNNNPVRGSGNARPTYNQGPPVREVERSTRTTVRKLSVVNSDKPGTSQINNNSIRVYRPEVKQTAPSANTRPERVSNLQDIRQAGNTSNDQQSTTPTREIPANKVPQINKNEPPVRTPANTPRVDAPVRKSPTENQQVPPANRNERPVSPPAVKPSNPPAPVRTVPDKKTDPVINRTTSPANNPPATRPQRKVENTPTPATQPVRRTTNQASTTPANNRPPTSARVSAAPQKSIAPPQPVIQRNEPARVQNNAPMATPKREVSTPSPTSNIRLFEPAKRNSRP